MSMILLKSKRAGHNKNEMLSGKLVLYVPRQIQTHSSTCLLRMQHDDHDKNTSALKRVAC